MSDQGNKLIRLMKQCKGITIAEDHSFTHDSSTTATELISDAMYKCEFLTNELKQNLL